MTRRQLPPARRKTLPFSTNPGRLRLSPWSSPRGRGASSPGRNGRRPCLARSTSRTQHQTGRITTGIGLQRLRPCLPARAMHPPIRSRSWRRLGSAPRMQRPTGIRSDWKTIRIPDTGPDLRQDRATNRAKARQAWAQDRTLQNMLMSFLLWRRPGWQYSLAR